MRVAVIGGTRHVGYALVQELLEAGHVVSVYNRGRTPAALPQGVQRVVVDRKCRGQLADALREHRPEAVIDMIAFEQAEVAEVFDALPDLGHYVFCSSTVLYGKIGRSTPDEATPTAADSDYGHGKVACDAWLMDKARAGAFAATSLRLAHPYGPRDHLLYATGRESRFLDRMRRGRTILVPGSGASRIHPVYVADAARAFVHVLGRSDCMGRIYNLSGEEILTLDAYFESIARVLGVPLVARKVPADFFRQRAELWSDWQRKFDFGYNWVAYESAFDTSALRATGFRCLTDHDSGVGLTLQWLDANDLIEPSTDDDGEDRILRALG